MEFQLTQDEFAEAVTLATWPKKNRRDMRFRILKIVMASFSVALLLFSIGIIVYLKLPPGEWDARTIANAIEVPGPWVFIFFLFQIPGLRATLGKRPMQICYILLTCCFITFMVFIVMNHSNSGVTYIVCAVFLTGLFWRYGKLIFRTLNMQKLWQTATHMHGTCIVDAADEQITITYPLRRTVYDWRAFQSWRESKNVVIILLPGGSFHVIPKRAFHDQTELQTFRDAFTEATKPRKAAFDVIPFAALARPVEPSESRNTAGL